MARKNRIVVENGVYHITTRVHNREFLFADDKLKSMIVRWMYDVADFSGVDLLAWCVMENHLHILVRVPEVPEHYWLDPENPPVSAARTMRPPECTVQRWLPSGDCPRAARSVPTGDSPNVPVTETSGEDIPREVVFTPPRPAVGFMLTDCEMLERLRFLYGSDRAGEIGKCWDYRRANGLGHLVDEEKERYCRRMYNVSQFAKTLKERIAMRYNKATGHTGHLFEGRFHSVIVEQTPAAFAAVTSYMAVNPVKARIATDVSSWGWSSYAEACGNDRLHCRRCYERMLGCEWAGAKEIMERFISDRLPVDHGSSGECGEKSKERKSRGMPRRITQAIWHKLSAFTQGAFISTSMTFAESVLSELPAGFNHQGTGSVDFCRSFAWPRIAA